MFRSSAFIFSFPYYYYFFLLYFTSVLNCADDFVPCFHDYRVTSGLTVFQTLLTFFTLLGNWLLAEMIDVWGRGNSHLGSSSFIFRILFFYYYYSTNIEISSKLFLKIKITDYSKLMPWFFKEGRGIGIFLTLRKWAIKRW